MSNNIVGYINPQGRCFNYSPRTADQILEYKLREITSDMPEAEQFIRPIEGECIEIVAEVVPEKITKTKSKPKNHRSIVD